MQQNDNSETFRLPIQIRVMIGVVSTPLWIVVYAVLLLMTEGNWQEISIAKISFTLLCAFIYYVVFTGRVPGVSGSSRQDK
jgi:hypothetical protein